MLDPEPTCFSKGDGKVRQLAANQTVPKEELGRAKEAAQDTNTSLFLTVHVAHSAARFLQTHELRAASER